MHILTLILFAMVAFFAQAQPITDTQSLTALETTWNDAHMKGDVAALEALWSDDLEVIVPKMEVMSKAQVLAFARSGRMRFQRYDSSDIKVRLYGDTAVVTGRLNRSRTINGNQVDDDWRFTKVYARSTGRWRVVLFQASDAAQP